MHKQLLLLRHGKSDWNTDTTDFYRPLNKRGNRNELQMGQWLSEKKLIPDLIISSPATRALSTAEIVCKAMGLATDSIQTDKSIYEASVSNLRQVLSQVPDSAQCLLLVGHNPSFDYFVDQLNSHIPAASNGNLMPTAALAYFELNSKWTSVIGDSWIQRAKELPK